MSYRTIIRGARSRYRAQDYVCTGCGLRFEELVDGANVPVLARCPDADCDAAGELAISAPLVGGNWRASVVTRGESERPPPGSYSTADLADGKVTLDEWRARRKRERVSAAADRARRLSGETGKAYSH